MGILYISNNDGTDTRIKKEIKTLCVRDEVFFLGNGEKSDANKEIYKLCKEIRLIRYKRNSLASIVFSYLWILNILIRENISSIHVVNEQLMIFYFPLFFFKHSVLDIFDSVFLKFNKPGNQLELLKRICYYPMNVIIVTDINRYNLMPDFVRNKVVVVENYPVMVLYEQEKPVRDSEVTIFYGGTLNVSRGTLILAELCRLFPNNIKVFAAGWVYDVPTANYLKENSVTNLGLLSQEEVLSFVHANCDYILSVYEPSNINNINASPNKVYDAMQCRTPLIINSEVLVSEFVRREKLGLVIDSFHVKDYSVLYKDLVKSKGSYTFSDENVVKYTWNNIEERLLRAHNLG